MPAEIKGVTNRRTLIAFLLINSFSSYTEIQGIQLKHKENIEVGDPYMMLAQVN